MIKSFPSGSDKCGISVAPKITSMQRPATQLRHKIVQFRELIVHIPSLYGRSLILEWDRVGRVCGNFNN